MRAPFPWFGGKSRCAETIWDRLGPVSNYVEPFAGSLAVMLLRPHEPGIETVNDKDAYLANFWRAVKCDPEAVAWWADQPVNEADLHARHLWLVCQEGFRERMLTDPDYFDAKIAGWWVWGISCWIGSGWCSRPEWRINGATVRGVHGVSLGKRTGLTNRGGIHGQSLNGERKAPELGQSERGLPRKRPICDANRQGNGVHKSIPDLSGNGGAAGRGIHGSGAEHKTENILEWMCALADRLRNVRVCCGDWSRVLGRSPTECIGLTGIVLDPPYGTRARRKKDIYAQDCLHLAETVRVWAVANGDNPLLRIVLCGYEGEHAMPDTWKCVEWKANGGYGNSGKAGGAGRDNAERERLWFSPHCLDPERQPELFPETRQIDDKLSRIARGSKGGEDPEWDLMGYLVLKRAACRVTEVGVDAVDGSKIA